MKYFDNLIKAVISWLTHSVYREAGHESPVWGVIGTSQRVVQLDIALTQLHHVDQERGTSRIWSESEYDDEECDTEDPLT